jgi:hypothetical protein
MNWPARAWRRSRRSRRPLSTNPSDIVFHDGYVVDKLEGFAFDASGKAYAVTDKDGVDESSGETLFFPVDVKGTN